MKTLLLGATGQIGNAFAEQLPSHWDITSLGRKDLDLRNTNNIPSILLKFEPELIINCAAFTEVDLAEKKKNECSAVNHIAVRELAKTSKVLGARLVHFSTDYVFDGYQASAYLEESPTDPLSHYGQTKLDGENSISETGCEFLIFRTSWVFAKNGKNFIGKIDKLLRERDQISVVDDQFGAPTSANFIAKTVLLSLGSNLQNGIYHLSSAGATSWFGLAQKYFSLCLNENAESHQYKCREIIGIPSSEYQTAASRPSNSLLDCAKLFDSISASQTDWQEQLKFEYFR